MEFGTMCYDPHRNKWHLIQ